MGGYGNNVMDLAAQQLRSDSPQPQLNQIALDALGQPQVGPPPPGQPQPASNQPLSTSNPGPVKQGLRQTLLSVLGRTLATGVSGAGKP